MKRCSLYIDSQHQSTLLISAYRVEAAAQLHPAKHTEQDHNNGDCHHNADLYVSIYKDTLRVYGTKRQFDSGVFQRLESLVGYVKGLRMNDGRPYLWQRTYLPGIR